MKKWIAAHYYETDPPESLFDETTATLPVNPNPDFTRTVGVVSDPGSMVDLPDPTWMVENGKQRVNLYVLAVPPSTVETWREDKGKITRTRAYNTALLVQRNLVLACDGQEPTKVINPYHFDLNGVTLSYSGHQWELGTLKKIMRDAGQWITNTHPLFVSEGGSASTPAQLEQRQQATAAAVSAYNVKALERARTALTARENGATDLELAILLGISPGSVPNYLSRARARVADTAA